MLTLRLALLKSEEDTYYPRHQDYQTNKIELLQMLFEGLVSVMRVQMQCKPKERECYSASGPIESELESNSP